MCRTTQRIVGLAFVLALVLAGGVHAQQRQQHHRGGMQTSHEQVTEESQETPQATIIHDMHGMMEHMQSMMQHMQDMMGHGGMLKEQDDNEDDKEGTPWVSMRSRRGMKRRSMMGHGHMMLRKIKRLAQQLDLQDDQETQVQALLRTHMKEAIRAQAKIAVSRIDLRDLLDDEPVDMAKVKELLYTIASKKADLHFSRVTLMQDLNKLLTPEQQEKFRSMRGHTML